MTGTDQGMPFEDPAGGRGGFVNLPPPPQQDGWGAPGQPGGGVPSPEPEWGRAPAAPTTPPELTAAVATAKKAGCLLGAILVPVLVGTMAIATTAALVGIWPGVLKLTAPVVCPDGFDDPLVVRDTTQVQPGETSTTFTLYCLNERGEATDEGVFRPGTIVFLAVLAGWLALVLLVFVPARVRRRHRR